MGLSVIAYRDLKITHANAYDKAGDRLDDVEAVFYKNEAFPEQYDNLVEHAGYDGVSIRGPSYAYSAHGRWREALAILAGYKSDQGHAHAHSMACWNGATGPFSELINFSDCEGAIGPLTSLKLAGDFAQFDDRARLVGSEFYEYYVKWRAAFEHASQNGAVYFG